MTTSWSPHPFEGSCVEKDMVAKTFGWAWDLGQKAVVETWQSFLNLVDIRFSAECWAGVQMKFCAYPPHFGGIK